MATSLGDLLRQIRGHLEQAEPDSESAAAALAALTHSARALTRLSSDDGGGLFTDTTQQIVVGTLAGECEDAAAAWPPATQPSTVPDLFGVAADVIGLWSFEFGPAQRWAVAVAVAETTRRCCQSAQRFDPYRNIPQLIRLHDAAAAVEQLAAANPPTVTGRVVLDRPIPATRVSPSVTGVSAAAEATPALLAALSSAIPGLGLSLADALACAAVAHLAATHATALADALHADAHRSLRGRGAARHRRGGPRR